MGAELAGAEVAVAGSLPPEAVCAAAEGGDVVDQHGVEDAFVAVAEGAIADVEVAGDALVLEAEAPGAIDGAGFEQGSAGGEGERLHGLTIHSGLPAGCGMELRRGCLGGVEAAQMMMSG